MPLLRAYKVFSNSAVEACKKLICLRQARQFSASVDPRDIELSYTTYPDHEHSIDPKKRPLIFLHGLFGAKGNLHSVSKHISDGGRKVITYDARNHGDSEHSPIMNFIAMAKDLSELMTDLKLDKPAVMGHSMGGKTAMALALSNPEKLSALIVADVAPGLSPNVDKLKGYAEAMKKVQIPVGTSLIKARRLAQVQLQPVVADRGILQFLLTNLRENDNGEVRWRMNLDAFLNNYDAIAGFQVGDAGPFTKPTLFVFGEKSDHYKSPDVAKIKTYFPNAEVVAIKNAGHFVHAEKPLEFVNIVQHFLHSVDSSSS